MSQDSLEAAKVTGSMVGQLATALITIVHLLKKQPGFDVASFENELQRVISNIDGDTVPKEIFKQCISLGD
ncbi:hypothetical protein LRQ11_10200 [Pseudomonas sp. MAFF 311095]|uniref:hypothetical protein n=1 Tax=Pseudomonas petroselini TaxID=2899822 RepID=UPI001E4287C8|nr:hypothetical protein [Pseudomonas petroselini]MCD7046666.1 hypothetical protein [Pseudomonas petroselini]MCD7068831.1 hypothetical protein [Pseudomonas petroselini]MCD7079222.1 hypothetical protein [Pseudomonas petroselini]